MTPEFPPTRRRLLAAWQAGNVPVSRTLVAAAGTASGLLALPGTFESLSGLFRMVLARVLEEPTAATDPSLLAQSAAEVVEIVLPVVVAAVAGAVTAALIQTAGNLAPRRELPWARPRWSDGRAYGAVRSVVVALAVAIAGVVTVRAGLAAAAVLPTDGARIPEAFLPPLETGLLCLAAVVLVMGIADAVAARSAWGAALWMTRRELEDERRESGPDAREIRARFARTAR